DAAHAPKLRFDPLLLRLAREGKVQSIRLMGDGTASLLADGSAVRELQAHGSTIIPVAPAIPVAASYQPLAGAISGVVSLSGGSGAGISGATVSAYLGTTIITTTTSANGSYSLSLPTNGDYQVSV